MDNQDLSGLVEAELARSAEAAREHELQREKGALERLEKLLLFDALMIDAAEEMARRGVPMVRIGLRHVWHISRWEVAISRDGSQYWNSERPLGGKKVRLGHSRQSGTHDAECQFRLPSHGQSPSGSGGFFFDLQDGDLKIVLEEPGGKYVENPRLVLAKLIAEM